MLLQILAPGLRMGGGPPVEVIPTAVLFASGGTWVALNGSGGTWVALNGAPSPAAIPTGVTVGSGVIGGSGVGLVTWNAAANATAYNVRRSPSGAETWTVVSTGQSGTSFQDGSLGVGAFDYEVAAVNAGGTSAYSAAATATYTAPFSPLDLPGLVRWGKPDVGVTSSVSAQFINANMRLSTNSADFQTGTGIDFGIAVWASVTDVNANNDFITRAIDPYEYRLGLLSGQVFFIAYKGDASDQANLTWGSPPTTGWHLYAAWRDAAAGKIWLSVDNGTPVSLSTPYPDVAEDILTQLSGPLGMSGNLACAGFWNRILAAQDLTDLWNGGSPRIYQQLTPGLLSGLIDFYSLDSFVNLTTGQANGHSLTNIVGDGAYVATGPGPITRSIQDGFAATTYPDQSGNGYSLFGGSNTAKTAAPPIWRANVRNGLPAFAGDGSTCYLYSDDLAQFIAADSLPFSLGFVFKLGALTADIQALAECVPFQSGPTHAVTEIDYEGTGAGNFRMARDYAGTTTTISGGAPDTDWHRLMMVFDGTTGFVYIDGVLTFSGSLAASAQQIGDRVVYMAHQAAFLGSATSWIGEDGYFGEDVLCSVSLSFDEVSAWDDYMVSRGW